MPNLFNKNLDDLEYEDIRKLVEENKISESLFLDYKQGFDFQNPKKTGDKIKQEIAKDITGLANSSGGYLIYGVSELKEDGANKPDKIVGIDRIVCIDGKKRGPSIEDWLNQIITGGKVLPKVNYSTKIIETPDPDKIVLILEINESLNKPHMVLYNNAYCYYARSGTETKKAEHLQVEAMFEFKDKYLLEFNNFRTRLNLDKDASSSDFAVSHFNQKLIGFQNKEPVVKFTLIPYNLNRNINFNKDKFCEERVKEVRMRLGSPFTEFLNKRLNHLGITYYDSNNRDQKQQHRSYFHIYKNGIIEFGIRYEPNYHTNHDKCFTVDYLTVKFLKNFLFLSKEILEGLEIDNFNLNITVLNVLGCNLSIQQDFGTPFYSRQEKLEIPNLHFEYDLTIDSLDKTQIRSTLAEFSDNLLAAFGIGYESEELPEFNRIFWD